MNEEKNKNLLLISLSVIIVVCFFLYFSRRVVSPFFIAFALAYLLDPLVDKMVSGGVSRTISVEVIGRGQIRDAIPEAVVLGAIKGNSFKRNNAL